MKKYNFIIVGSGFFGATIARKLTDAGKKCLVIDKNNHLAGAAHDFKWANGQIVSAYGAHIWHTNSIEVQNFIENFSDFTPFINKPKVVHENKIYSFPINLMTLHQIWGVSTPQEAQNKLNEVRIKNTNPKNFEEWILDKVGCEIYDIFYKNYTIKQWHKHPRDLPVSIAQRLPIRLTYDENYFSTKFQGMPVNGYTKLIENMLDGIDVELETDFFKIEWQKYADNLIYSGPVDRFFNYEFGHLEYNTLRFEHKVYKGDFQGNAVLNYTDLSVPYLRSVEHKHLYTFDICKKHYSNDENLEDTVVTYDIPIKFEDHPEPYYPIRDQKNSSIYERYIELKKNMTNVIFGGRLGSYVYCDLDQTVASALQKANKILND